jgi:5-formyltetrahydrofolate cyclo-ligase
MGGEMRKPMLGSKGDMRRLVREGQYQFDRKQLQRDSTVVHGHVQSLQVWSTARVIHTYVSSLPGEIITQPLIEAAIARGTKVLVPYVEFENRQMRHAEINGLADLQAGRWGLLQPDSPDLFDEVSEIDLVLVPGLLFDRHGYRVGQGCGFYDRFLSELKETITVGLTYDGSVVDRIPMEAHDIPVDLIITPSGVHHCAIERESK